MVARAIFSRSSAARRVLNPAHSRAFRPALSRPNVADVSHPSDIPCISYHDGVRTATDITARELSAKSICDVQKSAQALKPELIHHLTPTMKRFTLGGKIAVVTG